MSAPSHDTVRLHQALYSENAIHDAAATFADFASFSIPPVGAHYVVEMTNINSEVSRYVVAEFCNFALANSITRGRQ